MLATDSSKRQLTLSIYSARITTEVDRCLKVMLDFRNEVDFRSEIRRPKVSYKTKQIGYRESSHVTRSLHKGFLAEGLTA